MNKFIVTLLLLLACTTSWSQDAGVLDMTSPSLRTFLAQRPEDLECLTNVLSQIYKDKMVEVFYFYSKDESKPRSFQTYPNESTVYIYVREDQKAVDQFICLLFETLNSKGSERFSELCQRAESREISRTDFAQGLIKIEFDAVKKTRDLIANLKFSKGDIKESSSYESIIKCPDEFKAFFDYQKSISPSYDPLADYEGQYDALQKQ